MNESENLSLDKSEKTEKEEPKQTGIIVGESRLPEPKNSRELTTYIKAIADGGGFPKRFDTSAKQLAAYNLGRALMADSWQLAVNQIAPIQGSLCIYGELPGALAERTKEVVEKHVYCIDQDYNKICIENKNLNAAPFAGICIIQRKGREKKEFTYTIEEARHAGQYPAMKPEYSGNQRTGRMIENPDSPWMKHTKTMLMRKAMNAAVKFEFPDALAGVPIAEYDFNAAPDLAPERDITNTSSALDKLNTT